MLVVYDHIFFILYILHKTKACSSTNYAWFLHKFTPVGFGALIVLFYCLIFSYHDGDVSSVPMEQVKRANSKLHKAEVKDTGMALWCIEELYEFFTLIFSHKKRISISTYIILKYAESRLNRYQQSYAKLSPDPDDLQINKDRRSVIDSVTGFGRDSTTSLTYPSTMSSRNEESCNKQDQAKIVKVEASGSDSISQLTGLSWSDNSLCSHESDDKN